jgi:membrane associated rhomboid family serine protease
MRRDTTFQFGLPRFYGALRYIVIATLGIWVAIILLYALDRSVAQNILALTQLSPARILSDFWLWQFLTYPFVHLDPQHVLFSMVGVYFIGSAVQDRVGSRSFTELYIFSSVLAGVLGFLLALTGRIGAGPAIGAGVAANALLMVFYLLNRGTSIMLFPLPFQIPVLWVLLGIGAIEAGYFILSGFSLFYMVQLLGIGTGYVWFRLFWRRASLSGVVVDQIASLSNNYYRWKRRRAARKFEVYMRKHEKDPKQYFDEYGNFKPPDEKDKKDRGSGSGPGWVN